jgi:acetate kinase
VLVLAGGQGRRMRRLTLTSAGISVPKQFCSLGRGPSLLHAALRRARAIAPPARIFVTVTAAHRRWWRGLAKNLPAENILAETRQCGTGIGILHPLLEILQRDPHACIAILPSDHYFADEATLAAGLRDAMRLARSYPHEIMLLGFEPEECDPELGYIVPIKGPPRMVRPVQCFVEKPGRDAMPALAAQGALLNSFIVVARARTLLALFERRYPQPVRRLRKFLALPPNPEMRRRRLSRLYRDLPEIDFSFDIVSLAAARLRVVRIASCGWSDLAHPRDSIGRCGAMQAGSPRRVQHRPAGAARSILPSAPHYRSARWSASQRRADRMRILTFNCGSSSIKCRVVETDGEAHAFELRVENIGSDHARLFVGTVERAIPGKPDAAAAVDAVLAEMRACWPTLGELDAVVHRVVHGGDRFTAPVVIAGEVLKQLDALESLAPLHNPPAIRAIRGAIELFAAIPHVAVFDTAFHATLPRHTREYALPAEVRAKFGIRRYGFHGISHGGVAPRVAAFLKREARDLRVISCHLGSGASITAIDGGRSVETSMGMTPLEGLVMGTRAGDLDPGVLVELAKQMQPAALEELLNRRSGLAGLAGTADMREIERRATGGDADCALALSIYTHRIRKYLGAYAAVLGGADAIVFTGGVGEHSAFVRRRSVETLGFLGVAIDETRNHDAVVSETRPLIDVATPESRVRVLVLRADEEQAMANATATLLAAGPLAQVRPRIPIAVSARHAHLSQATIDRLFGPGYALRPRSPLSQSGQFSAQETVRLVGPHGALEHVRLMGPPREHDQVEISRSDEIVLGVDAPVRLSGDLADTPGVVIEGPEARVTLHRGVICARRHIHMNPEDARRLGVVEGEVVSVRIDSRGRDLVFDDVSVRISPGFTLELHLDTDEANAAGVSAGDSAELVRSSPHT